jgi:hypothetical protein
MEGKKWMYLNKGELQAYQQGEMDSLEILRFIENITELKVYLDGRSKRMAGEEAGLAFDTLASALIRRIIKFDNETNNANKIQTKK